MALSGTETLQVLATQTNGQPAAVTETVTTSQVAALALAGQSQTSITTLNTVGNGTLTATNLLTKITSRTGTQTAVFTDTTDTAANIIAAMGAAAAVGSSFKYVYINNTVFPATIAGGSGVTASGPLTVPANGYGEFLITYSAAGAVTLVGLEIGYFPSNGTFINNGVTPVTVANVAVTANSQILVTLKTVGGTVGASAPNVKTITPGTGFTISGLASDTSVYNYTILG